MFKSSKDFISQSFTCEGDKVALQLANDRENAKIVADYTAWHERGDFERGVLGFFDRKMGAQS